MCWQSPIRANAITSTFNREVEVNNIDTNGDTVDDDGNRPFFPDNYNNGTITFTNPEGYTGTATPAVSSSSTVTGVGLGLGGDNTNALPMGIGVNYEMMFSVQTTGPAGGVLRDTGSTGIGVNSSAQQSDSNLTQLTPGEQLLFSAITLNNVSFQDPLGLLMPGATITPKWTAMRSSNHGGSTTSDAATTSTDAAVTTDVTTFNTDIAIGNNYSDGLISPLHHGARRLDRPVLSDDLRRSLVAQRPSLSIDDELRAGARAGVAANVPVCRFRDHAGLRQPHHASDYRQRHDHDDHGGRQHRRVRHE